VSPTCYSTGAIRRRVMSYFDSSGGTPPAVDTATLEIVLQSLRERIVNCENCLVSARNNENQPTVRHYDSVLFALRAVQEDIMSFMRGESPDHMQ